MFQVVPPCGGPPTLVIGKFQRSAVSSRAPVWGAAFAKKDIPTRDRFQVVPPCGGHPVGNFLKARLSQFQVVPPCGGHPSRQIINYEKANVSSRAPVWGASSFFGFT